jgi:hypothetical protein
LYFENVLCKANSAHSETKSAHSETLLSETLLSETLLSDVANPQSVNLVELY